MDHWTSGYTPAELDEAQARYGLVFPPDLYALFLDRRPAHGYAWHTEDSRIRTMLAWPRDMLLHDVERGFWWPDWGRRPAERDAVRAIVTAALAEAPRLIPLLGHRFIPETPSEPGNPVFSMHGFDTIVYGADLATYFANEFDRLPSTGTPRYIPFWSDIIADHAKAYAHYQASDGYAEMRTRTRALLRSTRKGRA